MMKAKYPAILLVMILSHYHVFAQLTVFNVSSSDITDARRVSAQQQFEINDEIESSTTLTYGLGKNWEVGLNLLNLDYNIHDRSLEVNDTSTAKPYAPLLLANAQKVFEINNTFGVGIGAIAGTNLGGHHRSFVYYTYSNLLASLGRQEQYQLAAGAYVSNHKYLSDGPVYGFQAAVDAGIFYKKFHLLGDWISGSHQKGKLSLGFEIFLTERLPLALGWQRSNSDGSQAAIVQLTFLPK